MMLLEKSTMHQQRRGEESSVRPPLINFFSTPDHAKAMSIGLFDWNLSKRWDSIFLLPVWLKLFSFQFCTNGRHVSCQLIYYWSIKLNGENYVIWKFKFITILEALSLWLIVKGDEQKPTYPLCLSEWNSWETKEKVLIRMSVQDNIIPHIRNCKTSKDTWDKLKILY